MYNAQFNTPPNNTERSLYANYHPNTPVSSLPPQAPNKDQTATPQRHEQATKAKSAKLVSYGGKAAFQVEVSETKDGKHTVSIESAGKLNPTSIDDKRFNWKEKINFQLTLNELPIFISVMYGFIPAARFDQHGADNSKFFDIINQEKNVFFKMGAKDLSLKVAPIPITEAMHFGMLALGSYRQNFPGLLAQDAMAGIKVLVNRLQQTHQIKIPR